MVTASLRQMSLTPSRQNAKKETQENLGDLAAWRESIFLDNLPRLTTRPEHIKQLRQTILDLAVRGGFGPISTWPKKAEKLGGIVTLQNGYAFKSEWFSSKGIRLLRNINVGHGFLNWGELACLPEEKIDEFQRFFLKEGDIVLSLDRPFITTGTKVARVRAPDIPCLLLQRVGRFQLNAERIISDYLFLWIHSPHFMGQIDPGRSNGVPHIDFRIN